MLLRATVAAPAFGVLLALTATHALAQRDRTEDAINEAIGQTPRRRAVVLTFVGWKAASARKAVVAALTAEFNTGSTPAVDWASNAKAAKAARTLGVALDNPPGKESFASRFGFDFFIDGRVLGRGRKASTRVCLHDQRGEQVECREGASPLRAAALATAAVEVVRHHLQELAEHDEQRRAEAVAAEAARQAALARAATSQDAVAPPAATKPRLPWFSVSAGLELQTRHAQVSIPSAEPRIYDSSAFPLVLIEGHVRPLAASRKTAARGLFGRVEFAHSVGLNSHPAGTTTGLSTKAWRAIGYLGYDYRFLKDRLEAGMSLGFGTDVFHIAQNAVFPTTQYLQLPIGVSLLGVLIRRYLDAQLFGGYRLVFSDGDLSPRFGSSATVQGFDIGAKLGGALPIGFTYAIRFSYVRYAMKFSGAATDVSGTSGYDQRLLTDLLVGWQY